MFDCQPVSSDSAAVRTHFGFWKARVDAVAQKKPQVGWPPCRTFYKRSSFRTAILSLAVLLVFAFAALVFGRRALGMVPGWVVKP